MAATRPIIRVPVPDLCALWAETPQAPMNIALIGVFEGEPLTGAGDGVALSRIRALVEAHLDRAPMLRCVLRPTSLGQGTPVWMDAAHFDIAEHVVLAPAAQLLANDEDFLMWCARRSMIVLDRHRPLWRMDVVPGLPGGRVGVLLVLHHVVADGLRGVELVTSLLDQAPGSGDQGPAGVPWHPQPPPTRLELVRDNLRRRWKGVRRLRLARVARSARKLHAVMREPGQRAPRTSLTGMIGARRRLMVLHFPVADLRAAGHAYHATINDLLIAAVTAGVRDLLLGRGECREGLVLRASVPVGGRPGQDAGMFMAPLPVGVSDPARRLQLIVDTTTKRKKRADEGVAGIVAMPALLARLGVAWARRAAAGHINLYITNVPGPPAALYLTGARLQQAVPLAPLVAGVRLSVTALSYDGQFMVSLLADENMPDLPILAAGMRSAFRGYIDTTDRNGAILQDS